ncbi:MAG TPA: DinB family protein [Chitinophagaceae bacterium]|nr:DinB family protein [Chitinophagaceae bacterium]
MRRLFSLLPVLLLISFTTANDPLSKKDKKFAVSYFKQTKKDLQDAIKKLSDAQLNWKPADSVWSVAECIEHIALSEKNLFDFAQSSLKEAANPDKRKELKFATEQDVIKMITDRSFKVKTREGFIPSNQFGTAQKSLDTFVERRNNLIDYVKKTDDDLRNHFVTLPFGIMDTYQFLIFLAAHTKRHTLQIEEVKANSGFPKS